MAFTKIELPAKRSRRSIYIPAGQYYADLDMTHPQQRDGNYFSVLATFGDVQIAFGGRWYDKKNPQDPDDPLPLFPEDFILVSYNGHYEAQGNLFNTSTRIWFSSISGCTLLY
ncbi:hypothetical protein [Vibrio phage VH7D]|uniref:Uncharacterized protein n=2 Tax=Schizotequatrovirus TaxID=1198137 RepID=A0A126HGL3_9CAUD|nr:hypothetical protein CF80_gp185 [Vibrio phage VH7D]AGB06972.1 hypothetical protein [Vibrio phage VH7D]ALP47178.1 hypothetical protein phiGrn1_0045 [Vibrio phage phi-Grn1]